MLPRCRLYNDRYTTGIKEKMRRVFSDMHAEGFLFCKGWVYIE